MNEKNIAVQIWEGITYVIGMILGTLVVGFLVGALFAPMFEGFMGKNLRRTELGANGASIAEMNDATRKLKLLRLDLWLTCALAWGFLIVSNLIYWRIVRL